jgi:hypothetical protein
LDFRAPLDQAGKTATGITVPPDVLTALAGGKRPKVRVTLRGYTFRTSIGTVDGEAKIPVSAAVRVAAGVTAGESLDVTIELDDEPRTVELPADLSAALSAEPAAERFYGQLSYSKQRAFADWVHSARKPETRERRVAESVALLAAGRDQR